MIPAATSASTAASSSGSVSWPPQRARNASQAPAKHFFFSHISCPNFSKNLSRHRIVTITGHGIKEPKNLIVPIGTPFAHAIEAAGGLQGDVWKVIAGGPMMGRSQADLSTPVIKGTNAIVALTSADDLESPHPSCIRCGRCVSVCPMGLQPLYLYRFSRCRDVGMLRQYSILDCVECGCCAYTCPGKLPIVAAIREGKQRVREEPS